MPVTFSYTVAERKSVLVISLAGIFAKESLPELLTILSEIRGRNPRTVIINSCYLQKVDASTQVALQEFFAGVRRLYRLRFCFVRKTLREELMRRGLALPAEIRETFLDAVL